MNAGTFGNVVHNLLNNNNNNNNNNTVYSLFTMPSGF